MPNPLYNIPGYGGFAARRDQQMQQELGRLQQASVLMQLKERADAQKAAQAKQQMFQSAGGDLQKVMETAVASGDLATAEKASKLLDAQRKANAPLAGNPGTQFLDPKTLELRHQVPFAPRQEQQPNEVRLVEFYNGLPETDPRKPLIRKFIEAKTRPPEPRADPLDKPLGASDIGHWQGPDGKPPPPGVTMKDLITRGYKYVSTAQSNKAAEAMGAYATIDRLDELVASIWPEKGDGLDWRLRAKAAFTKGRLEQSNRPLVEFESFAKGTLAPLIRAVGEKGNLATEDIERAMLLIPNTGQGMGLPDTPEVARGKMKQLRQWFDRAQGKASAPNVDDLLRKYGGS